LTVTADLPAERVVGKDEKPADKTRLDKEFNDRKQQLMEKLAREKQCEKWIYLLPAYTVDSLLKPRHQLLEEPKKETKDAASTEK
jgi:hypothetical protein